MSSNIIHHQICQDPETKEWTLYIKLQPTMVCDDHMNVLYSFIDKCAAEANGRRYHIILDLSIFNVTAYMAYIQPCLTYLNTVETKCVDDCTILVSPSLQYLIPLAQMMIQNFLCTNKTITISTLTTDE